MLRFSFVQVQNYAHSAGLFIAKFQGQSATSYRFRVFDSLNKEYLEEDYLFETTSLSEIVTFVRGYRKAVAKQLKSIKAEEPATIQTMRISRRAKVDKIKATA